MSFFMHNIFYVMFVFFLLVIYIANHHFSERNRREINQLQNEIQELSWDYMTNKSKLVYKSRQSEVAKKVQGMGLKELTKPPQKIVVSNQ